jgi:hypothetical protein
VSVSPAETAICIGLGVTHFADDDHVRRLTERRPKRSRKVGRVDATSTCSTIDLHAGARTRLGSSMVTICRRVAQVDFVDQRREGRRLAGAGWTANQHQPRCRRVSASTPGGKFERSESWNGLRAAGGIAAAA